MTTERPQWADIVALMARVRSTPCPKCGAVAGAGCRRGVRELRIYHVERKLKAYEPQRKAP